MLSVAVYLFLFVFLFVSWLPVSGEIKMHIIGKVNLSLKLITLLFKCRMSILGGTCSRRLIWLYLCSVDFMNSQLMIMTSLSLLASGRNFYDSLTSAVYWTTCSSWRIYHRRVRYMRAVFVQVEKWKRTDALRAKLLWALESRVARAQKCSTVLLELAYSIIKKW